MLTRREVQELLEVPFTFHLRPKPVPADGRPIWRVPYVALLVRACRQRQATLSQLHVLNWALRSRNGADQLAQFLRGEISPDESVVRYEPALDRAVALATGLGILRYEKNKWHLTQAGENLLEEIDADEHAYATEKTLLQGIGRPLPQTAVRRLLDRGAA